ncbi:MAG: penicillin acylase family protein, partial [Chitinophagaceae bacterium]
GYLHAKFRLWQMELQALAAAGRATEVVGEAALTHDREFRRLGMVYAAEKALAEIEGNETTKTECDAYTAGVNAYISSLTESELPIEYKLIGYYPEKWTNLKTALFLKYMSYDLAAREQDFELTNTRSYFGAEKFKLLFPEKQDSLDPIIPGKIVDTPRIKLTQRVNYDTITFERMVVDSSDKPDRDKGSNNWAVSGSRSASGAPMLANDPHLGLNLPSLWFEMHLNAPGLNVYGVTFPGAPSIPIGFNDSIAWGVTNGGRDVRDYYEITFKDESRKQYLFNNEWLPTDFRIEKFKIKDGAEVIDTVAYTVHGPVMYDDRFGGRGMKDRAYAVRWTAHDGSNELLAFNQLNKAANYNDYLHAVKEMNTPGQNFVLATKSGDIAMRTQGKWPAKWKGQGDFLMPGSDSTYLWQGFIPDEETPSQFNPTRGFVSSANQHPADSSYPYYLGTDYPSPRGFIINRLLASDSSITVEEMMALQTNNYNVFAEMALPVIFRNISKKLSPEMDAYLEMLRNWNKRNDAWEKGATVFEILWEELYKAVYDDDYRDAPKVSAMPYQTTLLEFLLKDSAYVFIDDKSTPGNEQLPQIIDRAMDSSFVRIRAAENSGNLEWGKYKDTKIMHLTKLEPFSRMHILNGGGRFMINATKRDNGPSWRMIVNLTAETEAWGVYPGGQSGNPGSRFYDNFIDQWAEGKYYRLWMMKKTESGAKNIIGKITLTPA